MISIQQSTFRFGPAQLAWHHVQRKIRTGESGLRMRGRKKTASYRSTSGSSATVQLGRRVSYEHSGTFQKCAFGTDDRADQSCRKPRQEWSGRVHDPSHPILAWAVRHAGWLLTRCQVKSSGNTEHCSPYGREYSAEKGLFGETVFYKFSGTQDELLPRWEEDMRALHMRRMRSTCCSTNP